MTAGPEQLDSQNHEAWILQRFAMIQTALIGPAQQWYPHILKKLAHFLPRISKNISKPTVTGKSNITLRKHYTCFRRTNQDTSTLI